MVYLLKKMANWLMPHRCILCKNTTHRPYDLCLPCDKQLPILKHYCTRCANILPLKEQIPMCGHCLQHQPPFDETHGLFSYQPPIPKLILDLKFHHALTHAKLFGELLAEKILQEWYKKEELPNAIIPIPLHRDRLKERGFNQATEIARPIAKALKLPLILHGITRIKPTNPQATLSAQARKNNIKNAFLIKHSFENQHIAVVDDVITTGSTIDEFCRQLKKQGARRISVWCAARRQ